MKNIRFTKIIAFFMAVLMILPMIPTMDLTVFAEGESGIDLKDKYVKMVSSFPEFRLDPTVPGSVCGSSAFPEVMYVEDVRQVNSVVYCQVKAAEDYTWNEDNLWDVPEHCWVISTALKVVDYAPSTPGDGSVSITDANGNVVSEITMGKYEKPELTAVSSLEGDVSYQWQIEYAADQWVDIYGESSDTIKLSYGMVATLLEGGSVNIRCKSWSGTKVAYSPSIPVYVYETETNSFSIPRAFADDNTSGTTISDPVTVTIKYVLGLDDNNIVAEPFVSTIQKGTSYVYPEYELPVLEGYSAYLEDDTETIYTTYQPNIANVTEDIVITFRYWPAKVNYTVIYYWQNADNDNYIEHERVVKTDFTGNITTVDDKEYDGFYQLLYETVPIASDGSTVIEVYYDRLYYLMLFRLDGGYGVQPVYARHGAKFSIPTPIKSGYSFVGWDDVNDGIPDSVVALPSAMPIKNSEYKAIWKAADTAKVTVVFWGENPNDTEYSYISSDDLIVKPGISLTYDPTNTGYVCGLENHQHGTACAVICGQDAHTHSFPECYDLTCTKTVHTSHSGDCCKLGEVHTHTKNCYGNDVVGDAFSESISEWSVSGTKTNGSIGQSSAFGFGTGTKYIYIDGTWYKYTGSAAIGGTASTTCGNTHTAHSDDCCEYGYTHSHIDDCYEFNCDKHIHDSSCYNCGKPEHTHSSSCKLPTSATLNNTVLWKFNEEKTTEENKDVVVAADGTTVINVYYTRKTFTLTFKDGSKTVKTITEKWGAYIYDDFPIVGNDGKKYEGQRWVVPDNCQSFTEGTNVLSIDIMPSENIVFTTGSSGDSSILYYYVEALPEERNDEGIRQYNNKYYKLYKEVKMPSNGHLTEAEEFHDIEGYTQGEYYPSNIFSQKSSKMYLYYTLNSYAIEFKNPIDLIKKESNVPFGTNLGSLDFAPEASFAPSKYEPGSVQFDGWYLNPECTGEEYDLSKHTMPAAVENGGTALVLYAKWVPVTHKVRFYTDKEYVGTDTVYTASDGTKFIYDVPHGSKIQDPLIPPKDPTKGQYIFNGWYYIDANGNEQRWHFEETTVTRAVDVYAKWSSNTLMPYTVKFVYKDPSGKEIEIADPITGSALGGNSKTFDAKGNEQLYEGYREGYFPTTQSHTIVIDLDNTDNNSFTFYYERKDAVPYYVYYVTETQNSEGTLPEIELNGKKYYIVANTKSVTDNKKAIVTETYVPVAGYLPNNYQETLIINPNATADDPNEIIFIYSVDTVNSMYIVHYYFQDVTGTKYVEDPAYLFQSKAKIDSEVSAYIYTIDNFTHNPGVSGTALTGKIVKDTILELHVYYDRNTYPYKVQYLERGTLRELRDTKIVTGSFWESSVTENYIIIDDYTLDSNAEVTIQISRDTANPTVNIITFWYVKDSVINYVLVKPDGATDKYCGLSITQETVKGSAGVPNGSSVLLSGTAYEFVGWFTDENCTNRVPGGTLAGTHYAPASRTAATYYAKVVEVTVDIKYEAIGPAGASNFGTVTDDNLGVPVLTGTPSGTATPNAPTFKFVGWYDNKACTGNPISTDLTYVPQKTQNYHNDKDGKEILGHYAATYYAKFEYNLTSLTITKTGWNSVDPNQTFIFNVSGGDVNVDVTIHGDGSVTIYGLTVGQEYTITEKTNWSWRYECTAAGYSGTGVTEASTLTLDSASLYIPALGVSNNVATFENTRNTEYWLDGDSWCDNRFMANVTQAIN